MLFQMLEITDQIAFSTPEIKPEIAFQTVEITLLNRRLVRIAAAVSPLPRLTHTLRIFDNTRMLQHRRGRCAVCEEGRAVLVTGDRQTECILCHCNGAVSDQTVKAQSRNMQNLFHWQNDLALLLEIRVVFVISAVAVNEPSAIVAVNTHLIRHQRIQSYDITSAVPDDLRIGVAVDQQVRHERFPENERCHFRIGLIVQQKI